MNPKRRKGDWRCDTLDLEQAFDLRALVAAVGGDCVVVFCRVDGVSAVVRVCCLGVGASFRFLGDWTESGGVKGVKARDLGRVFGGDGILGGAERRESVAFGDVWAGASQLPDEGGGAHKCSAMRWIGWVKHLGWLLLNHLWCECDMRYLRWWFVVVCVVLSWLCDG